MPTPPRRPARRPAVRRRSRWPDGRTPSIWPAALTGWSCTATSPASKTHAAACPTGWIHRRGRPGTPGPLHQLFRTLCHQPRHAGPGSADAGRSAQRGARGGQGSGRIACGAPTGGAAKPAATAAEVAGRDRMAHQALMWRGTRERLRNTGRRERVAHESSNFSMYASAPTERFSLETIVSNFVPDANQRVPGTPLKEQQ